MAADPVVPRELWNQDHVLLDIAQLEEIIPQRYEMAHLDGIHFFDSEEGLIVGWKDVGEDEFWVRGHIPGRPLMPGVVMIEALAQLTAVGSLLTIPTLGFVGFGGVDAVKFRATVVPGDHIVLVGKAVQVKPRRAIWNTQGWVNGKLAVEATVTGVRV